MKWSDLRHFSKARGKFFWSFLYTLFYIYFRPEKLKIEPLRSDTRSLHFILLFFIYTILGPILIFSKIDLGQLYKQINFLKNRFGTTLYKNRFFQNQSGATLQKL